ncbi:hypothetical protein ACUY3B_08445 [Corynebacterium ureicelerivorans]
MTTPATLAARIQQAINDHGVLDVALALDGFEEAVSAVTTAETIPSAKVLQARAAVWPTISRGAAIRTDPIDGRALSGPLSDAQQREADRKWWRTAPSLRAQCLPLIVASEGIVTHAWEVLGWETDGAKWAAELGRKLSTAELVEMRAPYIPGDALPTEGTRAFWPVSVDIDGTVYRGGRPVRRWDPAAHGYEDID